jgi:hypothetical protein
VGNAGHSGHSGHAGHASHAGHAGKSIHPCHAELVIALCLVYLMHYIQVI